MRIIGGKFKGQRVHPPKKIPARPTTDIAKEGLFNILNNHWDFSEVHFLDLFGGTGCISYEMASRGCEDIQLVELDYKSIQFIKSTAQKYQFNIRIHRTDVFKFIARGKKAYDLIFAGPPYALRTLPSLPDLIIEKKLLTKDGWFILEHNPNHYFDEHPNFGHKRNYGSTIFSIFWLKEETPSTSSEETETPKEEEL